jgi:hypothetical protein
MMAWWRTAGVFVGAGCAQAVAQFNWTAYRMQPPGGENSLITAVEGGRATGCAAFNGRSQPLVWTGLSPAATHLPLGSHPSGSALALDGDACVGDLGGTAIHAGFWPTLSSDPIDLNPAGIAGSEAYGLKSGQQVGFVARNSTHHAALWYGSAQSFVDLHPTGASDSFAYATDGQRQGGYATLSEHLHAVLWSGSASSMMDLNPPGSTMSEVYAMVPGQQVGYTLVPGQSEHAAVWSGSAQSRVDLNPFGTAGGSILWGTDGQVQVGQASLVGLSTAAIWFGTPSSYHGLHQYLPAGYSDSNATSVWEAPSGTVWVGGYATTFSSQTEAWLWVGTPVPAPAVSVAILMPLGPALPRKRPMP